jgi:tripartite-type tricarboxylate transporter receptor subunit TctC
MIISYSCCRTFAAHGAALALALALLAISAPQTFAADTTPYPSKPIRIVVPFTAGNQLDVFARLIGDRLADALGQPVVVDNKPGMSGNVASDAVAKAAPDGHTLLVSGVLITLLPLTYGPRAIDPVTQFAPVTRLAQQPIVIVANPSLNVSSLSELIALAKKQPGKIAYATSGIGTAQHIAMTMLSQKAGIELYHVPYSNSAQLIGDVLGGSIPLAISFPGTVEQHLKTGRLKAVAQTGARRSPALPGVATIDESGFPGFEVQSWAGVLAPMGTPPEVIARLHREITRILALPEVRDVFQAQSAEVVGNAPKEFEAEIRASIARWTPVVKAAGISIN